MIILSFKINSNMHAIGEILHMLCGMGTQDPKQKLSWLDYTIHIYNSYKIY